MVSTIQPTSDLFEQYCLVDSDVHFAYNSEPFLAGMADHLDAPWDRFVDPNLIRPGYGAIGPTDAYNKALPGKTSLQTVDDGVTDPDADIRDPLCRDFGVDYPVLNSLIPLDTVPDTEQSIQYMRAHNRTMIEQFLDGQDDFYGLASLSLKRPDAAAEEIDALADEAQIVGVLIRDGSTEKAVGHPRYDPIYRAAADNDLAVVYHAAASAHSQSHHPWVFGQVESYMAVHAFLQPADHMLSLASLIAHGVPEKFPELDFVFLEAGLGWVPYMIHRLNREYRQRTFDAPLLDRSPEEYIRESFHFGTQPVEEPNDPTAIETVVELVGPESLLFTSDHPHYDFDNPDHVEALFSSFSDEERRMVFSTTAASVFGIDV